MASPWEDWVWRNISHLGPGTTCSPSLKSPCEWKIHKRDPIYKGCALGLPPLPYFVCNVHATTNGLHLPFSKVKGTTGSQDHRRCYNLPPPIRRWPRHLHPSRWRKLPQTTKHSKHLWPWLLLGPRWTLEKLLSSHLTWTQHHNGYMTPNAKSAALERYRGT